MFDFGNGLQQEKGLFTFYRQQAEIEQKISANKKKIKQDAQNFTIKELRNMKNRYNEDFNSSQKNSPANQILTHKKSFDQLINKDFIKRLSLKKQKSYDITSKSFGSQVVVIKKSKSLKQNQNQRHHKQNTRYLMQDGYFIKQKLFDPLQESPIRPYESTQSNQRSVEQLLPKRKKMKRNLSVTEKHHLKSALQNELVVGNQKNQKRNSQVTPYQNGIMKINVKPNIIENQQMKIIQSHRNYQPVHKRIPPKVLASILKNENHELIKHLRKQLQKQRQEENKTVLESRNHSFIEYGSHDYEKSGLDIGRLNQKQRRLITILNKFHKKPFTKVFIN